MNMYFDGACRKKNVHDSTGISGIGVFIQLSNKENINIFENTGIKTNNQAEYLALIKGLKTLLSFPDGNNINIYGDSLLVINQVNNVWKCNSSNLITMHIIAQNMITELRKKHKVIIKHILRNRNTVADQLSNRGIDERVIDISSSLV